MRATEFEFRYRFWFICLCYALGFSCYSFDHLNASEALVRWIFTTNTPLRNPLAARHALQASFALSALLVTGAAWVRTWGGAYLHTMVVHDSVVHTDRLVADGPYRHVRNPLYFGNLLFASGLALLASRVGAVVMLLGNLFIVLRLIGREESALALSQGDGYRDFVAAVPRLWPSLRARLPASGVQPRWAQAFLGEAWLWTFAVNGFLFAWKLNFHLYKTLLGGSAAAYFLMWLVTRLLARRNSLSPAPDPLSPPSPRS